jgi:ATP-binding cassette subfamily A (ABC1) protein 3
LLLTCNPGAGYHLVVVKETTCDVQAVTRTVQSHVAGACLESDVSAELSFILPQESKSHFSALFTELDQNKEVLGIASYGASVTTMEEVFIK